MVHEHLYRSQQADEQIAAAQWTQQIDACQCFDQINEPTEATNTRAHKYHRNPLTEVAVTATQIDGQFRKQNTAREELNNNSNKCVWKMASSCACKSTTAAATNRHGFQHCPHVFMCVCVLHALLTRVHCRSINMKMNDGHYEQHH